MGVTGASQSCIGVYLQGEENEVVDEEDEEDDGFLVPHGYLSNDEGDHSDGEEEMGFPEDVSLKIRRRRISQCHCLDGCN